MAEYKFIGTEALLRMDGRTVALKRLGQTVELSNEQFQQFSQRVPLLTQDQWHALALQDEMVLRFSTPMVQGHAPKEFIEQLSNARMDALGVKPPAATAEEAGVIDA